MRTVLKTQMAAFAAVIVIAILLSSCASVGGLIGQSASDKVKIGAEYSLTIIKTAWVPALKDYAALRPCGLNAPPCLDKVLYAKLYYATDAVTLCMQFATHDELTVESYEICKGKFDDARAAFSTDLKVKDTAP
jgi:hypothetical protein